MEVLTEVERRRIQVASPLRQVRVAATNIMPGRRVTANDIVYTFFLFDTDVQRHVVGFLSFAHYSLPSCSPAPLC